MSLLEIVKPAAQRRIQFDDNFRQTIPARALGPHPDAIVHGLQTLAPHPASPHFEVIAQKVKALPPLPTVSHVGLLGVKTQAVRSMALINLSCIKGKFPKMRTESLSP